MLESKLIHISKRGTNPDSKVHGANMGPPGSCRPQMGPILAPWTLLSGKCSTSPVAVWSMSCHLGGVRNAQLFITRSRRDCISYSCGYNCFLGFKHWSLNQFYTLASIGENRVRLMSCFNYETYFVVTQLENTILLRPFWWMNNFDKWDS